MATSSQALALLGARSGGLRSRQGMGVTHEPDGLESVTDAGANPLAAGLSNLTEFAACAYPVASGGHKM